MRRAQELYRRFRMTPRGIEDFHFESISVVALRPDGSLDQSKARHLVKLFRPDRNGDLTQLDFVRAIDRVYRDTKLLLTSFSNSAKVDRALERIFSIAFYIFLFIVLLPIMGIDPLALFAGFSSFIVGFSFMIGTAASIFFQGMLMIALRKPYDIGDRIHCSNLENDTSPGGSAGWFVRDLNLHTTTVVFATTGELATLNNGIMATARIINAARSPKAVLFVFLKFSVESSVNRIKVFEEAVRKYVKSKPREWISLNGFRPTRIEADLGYVEYSIAVQHRESWQQVPILLDSRANLASFCLELSKKLDLRYTSPPLPVDLNVRPQQPGGDESLNTPFQLVDLGSAASDRFIGGAAGSTA